MSDLHLEVGQQYANFHIIPCATYLILAGDIGRLADYGAFRDFLRLQCDQFAQVYLVLGNHEFFGFSRQEGIGLAEKLQQEHGLKEKLVVMNQRRVDLENVTILGCTLQSYIPPEAEQIVRLKVNDFHRIKDWTITDHIAEHAKDVKWLTDQITSIRRAEAGPTRKIMVITHHAPSTKGTSKPSHEDNPWSSAFGTDFFERKGSSCLDDVQWWIFGHTHHSSQSVRGSVKLVSNQRGYVLPRKDEIRSEISAKFVSKEQRLWVFDRKKDAFNAKKVIKAIPQSDSPCYEKATAQDPGQAQPRASNSKATTSDALQDPYTPMTAIVQISGQTQGIGATALLDPVDLFKGKLRAAATRDKFYDSADLRWLEGYNRARLRNIQEYVGQ